MPAVQLTFGGISTLLHLAFLEPGGMAPVPPVSISVVFRMCGCLLFSHVISFPVPFLIIVVFSLLSRSRMLSHPALVLNISILQEQAYVLLISDFWASWRSSVLRFPSLAEWWDEGKSRTKGLSIRNCCSRSGARSCNRDLLERLVDHLKSKVDAGAMSCLVLGLIILPSQNWPSWTLSLLGALRFALGSDGSRRARFRLPIFSALKRNGLRIIGFLR